MQSAFPFRAKPGHQIRRLIIDHCEAPTAVEHCCHASNLSSRDVYHADREVGASAITDHCQRHGVVELDFLQSIGEVGETARLFTVRLHNHVANGSGAQVHAT